MKISAMLSIFLLGVTIAKRAHLGGQDKLDATVEDSCGPCQGKFSFKKGLKWTCDGLLTTSIRVGTSKKGCNVGNVSAGGRIKFDAVLNSDSVNSIMNHCDYSPLCSKSSLNSTSSTLLPGSQVEVVNWVGQQCFVTVESVVSDVIELGCNVPAIDTVPLANYVKNCDCNSPSFLGFGIPLADISEVFPIALFEVSTPTKRVLGLRLNDENFAKNGASAGELVIGDIRPGSHDISWFDIAVPSLPLWSTVGAFQYNLLSTCSSESLAHMSTEGVDLVFTTNTPFVVIPIDDWRKLVKGLGYGDTQKYGSDGLEILTFCCSNPPEIVLEVSVGGLSLTGARFAKPYFKLPELQSDCDTCGNRCCDCPQDDSCVLMIAGFPEQDPPINRYVIGTKFLSKFYTVFDYGLDPDHSSRTFQLGLASIQSQ